jgi:hypothetical protein
MVKVLVMVVDLQGTIEISVEEEPMHELNTTAASYRLEQLKR